MRITSGYHVLVGAFDLRLPADAVLRGWMSRQLWERASDERDARWWLETCTWARGFALDLWEERRTNDTVTGEWTRLIDEIASTAVSGQASLIHVDNGHHVTTWKVTRNGVDKRSVDARRAPRVNIPADVREHLEAKRIEIDQRYRSLGLADELAEFVTRAGVSRCVALNGGTPELRARLLDRIAGASALPVRYVPDVLALRDSEQQLLVDQLREHDDRAFIVGVAIDPRIAIRTGRLRPDLYNRLSAATSWNLDDRTEQLKVALAG